MRGLMIEIIPQDDDVEGDHVIVRSYADGSAVLAAYGPIPADRLTDAHEALCDQFPSDVVVFLPLRAIEFPGTRRDDEMESLPVFVSDLIHHFGRAAVMAEVGQQCESVLAFGSKSAQDVDDDRCSVLLAEGGCPEPADDDSPFCAKHRNPTKGDGFPDPPHTPVPAVLGTIYQTKGDKFPDPPALDDDMVMSDVYGHGWRPADDTDALGVWVRRRDGYHTSWHGLLVSFGPVAVTDSGECG